MMRTILERLVGEAAREFDRRWRRHAEMVEAIRVNRALRAGAAGVDPMNDDYQDGVRDALRVLEAHAQTWSDEEAKFRALGRYDLALTYANRFKACEYAANDIRATLGV